MTCSSNLLALARCPPDLMIDNRGKLKTQLKSSVQTDLLAICIRTGVCFSTVILLRLGCGGPSGHPRGLSAAGHRGPWDHQRRPPESLRVGDHVAGPPTAGVCAPRRIVL